MVRWLLSFLGVLLIVAVVVWLLSIGSGTDTVVHGQGPQVSQGLAEVSEADQSASVWVPPQLTYDNYQSKWGALPPSLQGTRIPFFVQVDERGQLVVTEALRDTFDYFLTTVGEEPLDTILARIRELIVRYLPVTAQQRALDILDQYVGLKQAEIDLQQQLAMDAQASGQQADLAERARLLRDLRASHLDPETYAAFFAQEDQRDDYALRKLEVLQDKSLSDQEREQALEAIEDRLPPEVQEHLKAERQAQNTLLMVEQAKAEGASAEEVFQMREQAFGAEAATRFAEADRRKEEWDARIAAYRAERAEILAAPGMSDEDKQAQIEQLRQQHFNELELKRIPVIDRMLDQQPR